MSLNPNEAPDGFYAVLKSSLPRDEGNLCQFCDWRPECCSSDTDFSLPKHRCMPDAVRFKDGTLVCREDKCSVVFKRINGY